MSLTKTVIVAHKHIPEIVYYPRTPFKDKPEVVSMAKFEDGDYVCTYTLKNSQCDCPGNTYHRTQCKHVKLMKYWVSIGCPLKGFKFVSGRWLIVNMSEG